MLPTALVAREASVRPDPWRDAPQVAAIPILPEEAPRRALGPLIRAWILQQSPLRLAIAQWLVVIGLVASVLSPELVSALRAIPGVNKSIGAQDRIALWQQAFAWLPGIGPENAHANLPPFMVIGGLGVLVLAGFVLQAIAFVRCWFGPTRSFVVWLIGPIGAHLLMIAMPPMSSDPFFYAMSGDLANQGVNPYVTPLYEFPEHPLYLYNYWVEMKTVYGPFWTDINRGIMAITGPNPVHAILAYKLLLGAAAIGVAVLVWATVRQITHNPQIATAAGVLVAWQPNMIFETSGQAHNDPVMLLILMAGILLLVTGGRGAIRGALILVTIASGIKYVTLPILGLILLVRLTHREGPHWRRRLALAWTLDAIAIAAVLFAAYLPYWHGPTTLAELLAEPGRLMSNPLFQPRLRSFMREIGLGRVLRAIQLTVPRVLQLAVIALTIVAIQHVWMQCRARFPTASHDEDVDWWVGPLLRAMAVILTALAMVSPNAHSWYFTWPVVTIALLLGWQYATESHDERRELPHWFWPYVALTAIMTIGSLQVV